MYPALDLHPGCFDRFSAHICTEIPAHWTFPGRNPAWQICITRTSGFVHRPCGNAFQNREPGFNTQALKVQAFYYVISKGTGFLYANQNPNKNVNASKRCLSSEIQHLLTNRSTESNSSATPRVTDIIGIHVFHHPGLRIVLLFDCDCVSKCSLL